MSESIQRDLIDWRERMLQALLYGVCILGFPSFIAGMMGAYRMGASSGNWAWVAQIFVINFGFYAGLWWLAWYRHSPFKLRAGIFIGLIFGVGTYAMYSAGLQSSGRMFLLASVVFSGLLLGFRIGIAILLFNLVVLAALATLFVRGDIAPSQLTLNNFSDGTIWTGTVTAFGLLAGGMLLSSGYLVRRLQQTIEDRSRAQDSVDRYRERLEELVEKRTQELAQSRDQLADSERLASVGTLAAGIAHEINNPVASIPAAAEYALMCEDDRDARAVAKNALEEIVQQSERCGRIVRSVLQFSRNETTEKWPVNVHEIIAHACHLTAAFAQQHEAQVFRDLSDDPAWVELNPVEMEQVFVNLIRNGVQSKPEGARVNLSTEQTQDVISIVIQDNGGGIPEEDQSRIFDPFFTTRVQTGGTGLGLSVAHGIVSEHAGEISLSSELGVGTTVRIRLPLCPNEPSPNAPDEDPKSDEEDEESSPQTIV